MTRDHLMGYPPAAREDFQAPYWWESDGYGLGVPVGRRPEANECGPDYVRPRIVSTDCATKGDLDALGYDTRPCQGLAALAPCDREPEPEPPTISEAARWPFAASGWRNGDGGLGAQCERVRFEKLKAAEHERWLQRQQSAMWSSQQMYADKGKAA